MHLYAILVQIATFQLFAWADRIPSTSIWKRPPLGKNGMPFFTESDFENATGLTAYSLAENLKTILEDCMVDFGIQRRNLVLVPVYNDVSFYMAIGRALMPDNLHSLNEMYSRCDLEKRLTVPDSAGSTLLRLAFEKSWPLKSEDEETEISNSVAKFFGLQFKICAGVAWGMLAEEGSIAIEPEMSSKRRNYLGQLQGLDPKLTIPAYVLNRNQFQAQTPKYDPIKGLSYKRE